ncbi:MAG: hypothetical protein ACJ8R9_22620 [Steroidobacteraceae bacterium]
MSEGLTSGVGAVLLAVLISGCVTSPTTRLPAPYPRSEIIRNARWDLSTVTELRSAFGSDLWPLAWAADGELYAAWGDGGGFEGNESSQKGGKASLGFARISGTPVAGRKSSYRGQNVWGTRPFAPNQATFGGKVGDLISLHGTLYAQGGLWTTDNCNCTDPTQKGESNSTRTLAWSADFAKSWTVAPWTSPADLGATLQFGRDYAGAVDPLHVYLYYERDVKADPTHLYLRRVDTDELTIDPATPGHFEYFAGLQPDGTPGWSTMESEAVPVFTDPRVPAGIYSAPAVVYDAQLGRYLLSAAHGPLTGQLGLFEAAAPWGPWATVAYYDDWGGFNETASEGNGLSFPAKWISPDGKTLWAVFSGLKTSDTNNFDSFNVARLVLKTRRGLARIKSPASGTSLAAGSTVNARGAGRHLRWSASRMHIDAHRLVQQELAQGTGASFAFTLPADVPAGDTIRLTLTADGTGSVYRDFAIQ